MKKTSRWLAHSSARLFDFTSCARRPELLARRRLQPKAPERHRKRREAKACMVSDDGGFDDKSFNQNSHKGLLDAKAEPRHRDRSGGVELNRRLREEHPVHGGCKLQHDRHGGLPAER